MTLKAFGDVFEKYCRKYRYEWDGRLGTDFELIAYVPVSTRKGFSQTREKVVDLKRKKFGGSSSAKLLLNLNCFSSQD